MDGPVCRKIPEKKVLVGAALSDVILFLGVVGLISLGRIIFIGHLLLWTAEAVGWKWVQHRSNVVCDPHWTQTG